MKADKVRQMNLKMVNGARQKAQAKDAKHRADEEAREKAEYANLCSECIGPLEQRFICEHWQCSGNALFYQPIAWIVGRPLLALVLFK